MGGRPRSRHGAPRRRCRRRESATRSSRSTRWERGVQPHVAKLEEQRYEILDQKLEQLIGERLLAQEAKRRTISVEDLIKAEVYSKAPEVPEADVTAFINQNRARLPKMDDQELRLKVWDYLG